jgi:hypothetical protein
MRRLVFEPRNQALAQLFALDELVPETVMFRPGNLAFEIRERVAQQSLQHRRFLSRQVNVHGALLIRLSR